MDEAEADMVADQSKKFPSKKPPVFLEQEERTSGSHEARNEW
jgi:hypothetical protein